MGSEIANASEFSSTEPKLDHTQSTKTALF